MPTRLRRLVLGLLAPVVVFGGLEGVLWAVGQTTRVALSRRAVSSTGGQVRVAFSGDSVTFGLNVGPPQAYPAQLEALPRMKALGVAVSNHGVPGIGLEQSVAEAERALREDPETRLVVNLSGYNDCGSLAGLRDAAADATPPAPGLRALLLQSRSYRLLTQVVARVSGALGPPPSPPEEAPPPDAPPSPGHSGSGLFDEDARTCRERIGLATERLVQVVAARSGARLVLVTYPVPGVSPAVVTPRVTTFVNHLLRAEAARWSLPLVDAEACFRERWGPAADRFFDTDGIHLGAEGNAALARCVSEGIEPLLAGE